jgi:hypothetical protein
MRDERGSAVVEFTLVSVVLVGLFLAVLQVGLVLHVRDKIIRSAELYPGLMVDPTERAARRSFVAS